MAHQSNVNELIISICGKNWASPPLILDVMAKQELDLIKANVEMKLLFDLRELLLIVLSFNALFPTNLDFQLRNKVLTR